MLLVQAGKPVDATIQNLMQYLEEGDIIIDGGNEWCAAGPEQLCRAIWAYVSSLQLLTRRLTPPAWLPCASQSPGHMICNAGWYGQPRNSTPPSEGSQLFPYSTAAQAPSPSALGQGCSVPCLSGCTVSQGCQHAAGCSQAVNACNGRMQPVRGAGPQGQPVCRYENTEKRKLMVAEKGLLYMGMGVSGGEEGARNGVSQSGTTARQSLRGLQFRRGRHTLPLHSC